MSMKPLDLPFAAPVPVGHDVAWARLGHDTGQTGDVLVDRTSGVIYCEDRIKFLFAFPTSATEPLARATQHGWRALESVAGRVVAAIVATGTSEPAITTKLFVDASQQTSTPYR